MKKIILMLAFVLCMGGVAGAATLTDTTTFTPGGTIEPGDLIGHGGDSVNYLGGWLGDYVTWNHQFTFDPAAASLDSATLTISLRDDNDNPKEFAFGWMEGGTWDFGEVDTEDYLYTVNVGYLNDGIFQVTVTSLPFTFSDFYIDKSVLAINYTPAPTPEPMTLLLLGFGLVGLAGMKRKFKK